MNDAADLRQVIDTSILVRYLTGSPPDQASLAAAVVEHQPIVIPSMVLGETAYALGHHYSMPRALIVDLLVALLNRTNVTLLDLDRTLAIRALEFCRPSNRVSFGDAIIWAQSRTHGISTL